MNQNLPSLRGPHVFSIVVLAFAALLVWWGAAVTTKDVGLAVPDWPLSRGKVNPKGWMGQEAMLLEHGHRLIASFVGTLTAFLFFWIWMKFSSSKLKTFGEFALLLVVLATIVFGVAKGYAFETANSQAAAGNVGLTEGNPVPGFILAAIGGAGCFAWLCFGWTKRGWALPLRLSALALIVVEIQAVLGGLRVTEMSDAFGVIHGCLGQAFFCLLLLVTLVTSARWESGRAVLSKKVRRLLRGWALFFFGAVFTQLAIGATMRHNHRIGLAADDIVTTGGSFLPDFGNFDLVILFSHKVGAVVVFLVTMAFTAFALRFLSQAPGIRRAVLAAAGIVNFQVCLGISVLATGKSFWVTNFHVLTGLTLLAVSILVLAKSCAAAAHGPMLADDSRSAADGTRSKTPAIQNV
jgi:heme A synthase